MYTSCFFDMKLITLCSVALVWYFKVSCHDTDDTDIQILWPNGQVEDVRQYDNHNCGLYQFVPPFNMDYWTFQHLRECKQNATQVPRSFIVRNIDGKITLLPLRSRRSTSSIVDFTKRRHINKRSTNAAGHHTSLPPVIAQCTLRSVMIERTEHNDIHDCDEIKEIRADSGIRDEYFNDGTIYQRTYISTYVLTQDLFRDSSLTLSRFLIYTKFSTRVVTASGLPIKSRVTVANQQTGNPSTELEANMTGHELPVHRQERSAYNKYCYVADLTTWLLETVRQRGLPLSIEVAVIQECHNTDRRCKQSLPEKPFIIMDLHSTTGVCNMPSPPAEGTQ